MEFRKTRKHEKKPLWRKINRTVYGTYRLNTAEKYSRNKKEDVVKKTKMNASTKYGDLDFTPLYKFLLKNIGNSWDTVKSEALSRLPKDIVQYEDPFNGVVLDYSEYLGLTEFAYNNSFFSGGHTSMFSQLYVNEEGLLALVNPELSGESIAKIYSLYPDKTYTFNGKKIIISDKHY